jgi:hypothetical protein
LAGNIWSIAVHNFSDGSLYEAHLLQEVEVASAPNKPIKLEKLAAMSAGRFGLLPSPDIGE